MKKLSVWIILLKFAIENHSKVFAHTAIRLMSGNVICGDWHENQFVNGLDIYIKA